MHPSTEDINEIYHLWKTEFAFDDGGFTDDFFKRNFTLENCYILRINGIIATTLCAFPHTMTIANHHVPTMFISGVITKKEYRHKGYMRKLFQEVFDLHRDSALFLLQAYHPEIYTPFAFHEYYYYHVYQISHSLKQAHDVVSIVDPDDMNQLSNGFLSNFEGYLLRDIKYYENYIKEASAQSLCLFGIYEQKLLQGFARFDVQEGIIEEMMYTTMDICQSLISYAQTICPTIKAYSFKPLPYPLVEKKQTLMVRLHNPEILKNILNRDIHTLEDVYALCDKELYHSGSW